MSKTVREIEQEMGSREFAWWKARITLQAMDERERKAAAAEVRRREAEGGPGGG